MHGTGLRQRHAKRVLPWPALLVLIFIVSLPAVTPRIYASDEVQYFSFLRSLWFDGDVSFENEYRYFHESGATGSQSFHDTFLGPASKTETGRRVTFATIGSALLWAPFYAAADVGVRIAKFAGSQVAADGYSRPYLAAVAYGSACYGFLALMLALHACRLVVGGSPGTPAARGRVAQSTSSEAGVSRDRTLAVLAVWFGTPLLFYMYVAPPFAHATSAFAVAAFVVTWLHVRRRWTPAGLAALGALAALMTMVREQDVLIALGAGLDFAWTLAGRARLAHWRDVRSMVAGAAVGIGAAAVAYLPQALAYLALNGRVGPSRLVTRKMTWTSPHAWQVLASPEHGFLFWTPLLLLAVGGLVVLALGRRATGNRLVAVCLLLSVALQVYIAGAIESWTVAGAFGQRRFVGLTVILCIGLAALLARAPAGVPRRLVVAALVLTTWWNLALMVQFATGMMDRQRLALATNAWNAFVVVPRELPRIAYRYAFDRTSFYAPKP